MQLFDVEVKISGACDNEIAAAKEWLKNNEFEDVSLGTVICVNYGKLAGTKTAWISCYWEAEDFCNNSSIRLNILEGANELRELLINQAEADFDRIGVEFVLTPKPDSMVISVGKATDLNGNLLGEYDENGKFVRYN